MRLLLREQIVFFHQDLDGLEQRSSLDLNRRGLYKAFGPLITSVYRQAIEVLYRTISQTLHPGTLSSSPGVSRGVRAYGGLFPWLTAVDLKGKTGREDLAC